MNYSPPKQPLRPPIHNDLYIVVNACTEKTGYNQSNIDSHRVSLIIFKVITVFQTLTCDNKTESNLNPNIYKPICFSEKCYLYFIVFGGQHKTSTIQRKMLPGISLLSHPQQSTTNKLHTTNVFQQIFKGITKHKKTSRFSRKKLSLSKTNLDCREL